MPSNKCLHRLDGVPEMLAGSCSRQVRWIVMHGQIQAKLAAAK